MSKIDPDASGQPNPAQAVNREGEAALSLFSLPDLFDTLPEAVVVADRTRRVVYLNAAAEALFGYSLRDLRGRTTDVFYADHADFLTLGKEHYNGKTNPSFSPYRVSYRCSDGSRFLGQTSARGLTNAQGEIRRPQLGG